MLDTTLDGARQQFQEQIDFFRAKLNVPTERWDDIKLAAHDRAFMVAGAQKADLLNDLRAAVDKAITGESIGTFRKDFAAAVRKSGWSGWTGEGSKAGEAWRTRVIYTTNVSTSYAAGRWQQLNDPELLQARPFWEYIHADGVMHPRPLHLSWNGLTLPHDHEFWVSHFAPNGWGCHCRVRAVRKPAAGAKTQPPEGWNAIDAKTGAPVGIDKGWDYAPGANAETALRQMVQDKLVTYPPAITKALTADVNRYINAQDAAPDFVRQVLGDRQRVDPLFLGFVENVEALTAVAGTDVQGFMILLPADAPRHVDRAHGSDGGTQRAATPEDYSHLWEVLDAPDLLRAGESLNGKSRLVVEKELDGETLHAVFEVRPGKKNRALALVTLVVKLARKKE